MSRGIDVRRFPWIRPLVAAYASEYATVEALFAGDPSSPDAWARTIARVTAAPRDRKTLSAVVSAQLDRRAAPDEARAAARRLADPSAVAVVTGQQAALFAGPLYTLLKAVTAIQLSARITREHGVPAVPVFWVNSEDHNWDEVREARVLNAALDLVAIELRTLPGAGVRPASALAFDDGVVATLAALSQALAPTEFTPEVGALFARHYREGAGMGTAFAGVLDELAGRHGLVVFDAADAAAKPLVAGVFARELEQPGKTAALVREAGARMSRLGHAPQVEPDEDAVAVFYLDEGGRRAIRWQQGGFAIGGETRRADALRGEAVAHPERFSPNVLLRPLVEDRLFPTVCYVGGPSELAYQAQLGEVYRAFGVERPLLYSRASATLVDSASLKFLDRLDLPFEALHARDDSALNRLLDSQLPPDVEQTMAETDRLVAERVAALKHAVAGIDPTLAGAAETTETRVRETLANLHGKIIQAIKRKDETLRRQFTRTRALVFPDGQPQERIVSVPFFLNRYGVTLADRLLDVLPVDTSKHWIIQI